MAKGDNYGFTISFQGDINPKRTRQGMFRTRKQAQNALDVVFKGKKYKKPRVVKATKKEYIRFVNRK
tara:strand:+ start:1673 stop:1873 length:201 start_codon:yes stop_codon:yes gene_type:complete